MTFHRTVVLIALASSPSLALVRVAPGGNMIGSVIEGVTKVAPSHSHGDDMHQQATAHVLRWALM